MSKTIYSSAKSLFNPLDYCYTKDKKNKFERTVIILFMMFHTTAVSMGSEVSGAFMENMSRSNNDLEKFESVHGIERKYCKLATFSLWCFMINNKLFTFKIIKDE